MSLRQRITLTICSVIIFLLMFLSGAIYNKSASILNEEAEKYMLSQLERAQENIDLRVRINRLETEALALDEKVISFLQGKISTDKINSYLVEEINKKNRESNNYKDLFILNNEGIIIATCMPEAMNLDLSTRKYFVEAKELKDTVTSDILVARSDGSLIVITVSPIRDSNNKILGYSGIAIKAEYFSKIVNKLKLGETGYYSIVDSNNMILAHRDKELIAKESVFTITNEILKKSRLGAKNIVKKQVAVHEGIKQLQIYKLMESKNWILIAVLPASEMYEKSIALLSYVMLIGTLGIIVAMFIGIYVSDKISKPIIAITKYLDMTSKGNLMIGKSISESIKRLKEDEDGFADEDESLESSSKDEIGNLRNSLKNLKKYFISIASRFEYESEKLVKQTEELASNIESISNNTAKFISTLSHDLKTSITLIKGYAKGLKSGIIKDEEVRNEFLDGIVKSAEDIEKITCDILDDAYEAHLNSKLHLEMVDAQKFINEIFESTRQYVISSNRVFQGTAKYKEGFLKVDIIKIKRAWNNLINNAVKYSKEGSRITVNIIQTEGKIKFEVKDEGRGIDKEDIDKIFEMFHKGKNNEKKGYGLGLFITKSIIDSHNSKIFVESEYGVGTTFWFYLKVYEDK